MFTVVPTPSAIAQAGFDLFMPGTHRKEKERGKEADVIAKSGIGVGPMRRH